MTTLREIMIEWQTASGSGKRSVLYFDATPTVSSQRTALQTFLTSMKALQASTTSYGVAIQGVEIDDATGNLLGAWSEPSLKNGTGTSAGTDTSDASQLLVQWKTAEIINNRFLRGRTFFPGVGSGQITNGNLSGAAVTAAQGAANAFIASSAGLRIWHRPGPAGAGSSRLVTTAAIWSELAVLRRRRG